jgi:hypothetical protein
MAVLVGFLPVSFCQLTSADRRGRGSEAAFLSHAGIGWARHWSAWGCWVPSLPDPVIKSRSRDAGPEETVEVDPAADRDELNRIIGAATGIVMMQRQVSYAEGLGFLQHLSRQSGQALHELARDVTATSEGLAQRSIFSQDKAWAQAWTQASARLNAERPVDDLIAGRLLDLLVDRKEISDVLHEMTELAVDIVPGCESASITVIHDGVAATVAASDEDARTLDELQYTGGDGPCLQAARTNRMIQVDDFAADSAEEEPWRARARDAGVTASLSMPVPAGREVIAALNLYTVQPAGWTRESLQAAQALVTYTGDAIALALRHSEPDDLLSAEL